MLRQHDPVLPWFSSWWVFAGQVLALPFYLLHGLTLARCWMHELVTSSSHQPGAAQRVERPFGYPCSGVVGKSCGALSYNKYISSGKIWVLDSWFSLSLCWVEASPLPSVAVSGEAIHRLNFTLLQRGGEILAIKTMTISVIKAASNQLAKGLVKMSAVFNSVWT